MRRLCATRYHDYQARWEHSTRSSAANSIVSRGIAGCSTPTGSIARIVAWDCQQYGDRPRHARGAATDPVTVRSYGLPSGKARG